MSRTLDIALLQTCPRPDFESALDEAMPMASAAVQAGAEFLFLPEYCGGLASSGAYVAPPAAPEAEHPVLAAFQAFAKQHQVWVMPGSIAIHGPGEKILNRGYVIDNTGMIRSRYDKIHMFDIQVSATEKYEESARVAPGSQAVVVDTPFGRIGHSICYDLRFPYLFRDLAQAGAEMLCVPAAFVKKTGQAHWHVLNRARAIENGAFVIAPGLVGPVPGGGECFGHSLVVDPWGEIVADGGDSPGVVRAVIDLDLVRSTRQRIPSLQHDRAYAPVVGDKS